MKGQIERQNSAQEGYIIPFIYTSV